MSIPAITGVGTAEATISDVGTTVVTVLAPRVAEVGTVAVGLAAPGVAADAVADGSSETVGAEVGATTVGFAVGAEALVAATLVDAGVPPDLDVVASWVFAEGFVFAVALPFTLTRRAPWA